MILLCRLNGTNATSHLLSYAIGPSMKSCKGDRNHVLSGIGITDILSCIGKLGEAAAKTKRPLTGI